MKKGQPRYAGWKTDGFPGWLAGKLDEREWKIADLGRHLGLTTSAVARWMTGQNTPSHDALLRLADVLNVSYDEVLTEAGLRPRDVPNGDPRRAELSRRIGKIRLTEKNYKMLVELIDMIDRWDRLEGGDPPLERHQAAQSLGNRSREGLRL
jgi:transcriptional regulator with XRE-family HTH domain